MEIEEILEDLKKNLLNKEMTLLEMDNYIENLFNTNSLYDDFYENVYSNSCSYYYNDDKNIVVEFEFLETLNDKLKTKIKVTDIWED